MRPRYPASTISTSNGAGRYFGSLKPSNSTFMTASSTSSPIRSHSASGPIGWLAPSFIALSISSALARPSASAKIASLIIGQSRRFTTNPGLLRTFTGVFPIFFATASAAA
ncbi:MAG: hypothetical protein A3H33_03080 [Betaproteobacteria bacterium RIFCSPLOWO2_02_FULL_65_20]|nr:MAG: hypothetical protein A3H33_03080 [Betaproteobacteria bacterium RIFCSPLOWO2_02_FULL_65_20]